MADLPASILCMYLRSEYLGYLDCATGFRKCVLSFEIRLWLSFEQRLHFLCMGKTRGPDMQAVCIDEFVEVWMSGLCIHLNGMESR